MKNNEILLDISLPENMRDELKEPLGILIERNPNKSLLNLVETEKPPLVILVGDYCVQKALENDFTPDISVIDGRNLRKPIDIITIHNAKVIKANNPPAKITTDAWQKMKDAIKSKIDPSDSKEKKPIVLLITGEEDLVVFPAVLESPLESFVVYGQPHKGIVLIKVTSNVKFKFKKLIERMKVSKNED